MKKVGEIEESFSRFFITEVNISSEDFLLLTRVLTDVWKNISDELTQFSYKNVSNEEAIRESIQLGRPTRYSKDHGKEAEAILNRVIKEYGWLSVNSFLTENINLVIENDLKKTSTSKKKL